VLVGAFEIEVRRPVAVLATFDREGVGAAAVEPDVENIGDLLVLGRVVDAQEVAVGTGEPGVGAAFAYGGENPGV